MKSKIHSIFPLGILALAALTLPASAATLYWDGNSTTANADGGAGAWDTLTANWDSALTGGTDTLWTAANVASFGVTGGLVTVDAAGITAQRLLFTANGYTLSGGDITLTAGSAGGSSGNSFNITSGVTATINSKIITANQMWMEGGGTLVLGNAANSINSWVVAGASTLQISDFAQLGGGQFYFNGSGQHTLVYTGTTAAFTNFNALYGIGGGTNAIKVTEAGTTVTLSQNIQNNSGGTFVKLGAGTLSLTGTNSFAGATTVSEGTLQINNPLNSAITVASGATLRFNSAWQRHTKAFSGAGAITYSLDGQRFANDWSGFTGTLTTPAATRCFFANPVAGATGAAALTWGSSSARWILNQNDASFTGNAPFAIEFGGTGWASGSVVNVSFGTLEGGNANTVLGAGAYSGTIASATVNISVGGANLDATFNGRIMDALSGASAITTALTTVTKQGTGVQAFSAANTYSGATSVNSGTLRLDATPGSGHTGQYWVGNGSTTATAASLMLGGNGGTGGGVTLSNLIGINPGSGNNRTLGGSNAAGTTNTYSGTTYSNGGSLTVTSTNAGANLAFTNAQSLDLKSSSNALFNGAGNTTVSGAIYNSDAGTGSVTKSGTGTLTLSGTNTYGGTTTVNQGTLLVNGDQSGATGAVAVSNTGTRLAGVGSIGGATTIHSGAIHSPGALGATGSQTFSNNLSYGSGSIFEWNINSTANTSDSVAVGGTLTVGSGAIFKVVSTSAFTDAFWNTTRNWNVFGGKDFSTFGFEYVANGSPLTAGAFASQGYFSVTNSGQTLTWTAVPEPTAALAGLLLGSGLLRRSRRARGHAGQDEAWRR